MPARRCTPAPELTKPRQPAAAVPETVAFSAAGACPHIRSVHRRRESIVGMVFGCRLRSACGGLTSVKAQGYSGAAACSLEAPHQSRAQATRAQPAAVCSDRCGSGQRRKMFARPIRKVHAGQFQCPRYVASRSTPPRWPRRPASKGRNACDDRRDGRPDNEHRNRNRDGRGDQRHRVQFTFMILLLTTVRWPYPADNPTAAITSAGNSRS